MTRNKENRGARPARRGLTAVAPLLVVGLLAACGSDDEGTAPTTTRAAASPATSQPSTPTSAGATTVAPATTLAKPTFTTQNITFVVSSNSIANDMVYQAVNGGFLKKYGIEGKIVVGESSAVAMAAVVSGDAQFMSGSRSEGVNAQAAGQDIQYVLKHSSGFLSNVVITNDLAAKLGNINSMSLNDKLKALNGLNVAQPSAGSVLTKVLDAALATQNAKANNTFMALTAMPAALQTNRIDAFMAPSPYPEQVINTGEGVLFFKGNDLTQSGGPDSIQAPLFAKKSWIDANRDVVVRVHAGFLDAAEAVKADEAAARARTRARFTSLDDATFDAIWKASYDSLIRPLDKPLTAADVDFIIKTDVADNPKAQALDATKLVVAGDILTDAKALQARMK